MLVFKEVTKTFGNGTTALSNVSFEIKAGEFVVIEGKSGAGKTTLMRLLLKDLEPTSGEILVDGDNLAKISRKNIPLLRRKIGVVFQDFKILMDRTVAENIDLALDILGLSEEVSYKRRQELLELTGLKDKAQNFPVQLSGGQLQRVIIARALAGEPKLLFADEPTGNLDAETAMEVISLLKEINTQGTTVIMATHDTHLLKDFKARRLELAKGKLVNDSGEKPKHEEKAQGKPHKKETQDE